MILWQCMLVTLQLFRDLAALLFCYQCAIELCLPCLFRLHWVLFFTSWLGY